MGKINEYSIYAICTFTSYVCTHTGNYILSEDGKKIVQAVTCSIAAVCGARATLKTGKKAADIISPFLGNSLKKIGKLLENPKK